ncbi:MAG: class I SAM-dependent methyltransferase [Methanomassiliicoccales archaeon]|nr:MAG: class I SAM-dependent methyltransferase [Methanomassiliicoccales archaeon]
MLNSMEETWFDKFAKVHNVVFTEEDYKVYSGMVKEGLPTYRKYLEEGARILDAGCGLGCTSVPLSREGYDVVGIDNDPRVIEAAKQNGQNFGGKIDFKVMDVFDIDKKFGKDSFDACIHGGVLEHFSKEQIRELVDKQLYVAPTIVCSVVVRTEETLEHYQVRKEGQNEICVDGVERNLWTEEQWLSYILQGYNIVQSKVTKAHPKIGNFHELHLVIKRPE